MFSRQVLGAAGGGEEVVEVVCFRAKSWVLRTTIKRPLKCKANFIAWQFLLNENGVVQWEWGGGFGLLFRGEMLKGELCYKLGGR